MSERGSCNCGRAEWQIDEGVDDPDMATCSVVLGPVAQNIVRIFSIREVVQITRPGVVSIEPEPTRPPLHLNLQSVIFGTAVGHPIVDRIELWKWVLDALVG
jgi:hypothetical protein